MKNGTNSLKMLKVLLAISWWGTIAATGLMLMVGTMAVFDPGSYGPDLLGAAGSLDSSSLSAVTPDGLPANVEFQEPVRLRIMMPAEYWESRRGTVALGAFAFLAVLGLFLYFLRLLRQIVGSVEEGNPFVSQNARRLRIMAALIILGGVGKTFFEFTISGYADAVLRPSGFNLDGRLGFDFASLIAGLSVIVLSEVFRIGAAMREEQDLTV